MITPIDRIMFSILVPTRGRSSMFTNLCHSINNTTLDKNGIEMLVGYDNDDQTTHQTINRLANRYCWLRPFRRQRGASITRDYHNWLFPKSQGKFIIVINDDCEFRTNRWDYHIKVRLGAYLADKKDDIVYGWIADSYKPCKYPFSCFPLVSRSAVKALGYVMHEGFPGWGADSFLYAVFSVAQRIADLSDIVIYHISPHLGLRDNDAINTSMMERSIFPPIPILPEVRKIRKYINNKIPL